jgi:hypothetical protein
MRKLFRTGSAFLLLTATAFAQDEQAAVERAVLDYVEAIEQGKPELMRRSVHTDLHKFGFFREGPEAAYQIYPMTFDELVELAATFKQDGRVPADARHSVEILDVLDQTASVKLTAFWGVDYLHLAKYDGEWKIVQVLWQSHPPQ